MAGIIIFLGIILIIATVINPFVVLPVFIFSTYIEPMQYFPQLIQYKPTIVIGISVIFAWLVHIVIYRDFVPAKSRQAKLLVCFIAWALISSLIYGKLSMDWWFLYLLRAIIPYFLFIYIIRTREQITIVVWMLLIAGFITAFYGIYQLKANIGVYDRGVKRILSFFSNPNAFGKSLLILVPLTLGMLFNKQSVFIRIVVLSILVFLTVGIIISYSRGASLGFVVAIFLFVIKFFKREKKIFAGIAVVFLILLVAYFFPSHVKYTLWGRLSSIFQVESFDELDAGRVETGKAGMRMMMNKPLFGVGLGNFTKEYIRLAYHSSDIIIVNEHAMVAHNLYVEIGSQLGLIGLILYLLVVLFIVKDLYYSQKIFSGKDDYLRILSISLQISLFVFLFCGFITSGLGSKTFWMLASLSLPLRRIAAEEAKKRQNLVANSKRKLLVGEG